MIWRKKRILDPDNVGIISAGNHKMAALFYDNIIPMHSESKVPRKYRVDVYFPKELKVLVEMIDSIAKSPYDKVNITNGDGFFQILEENPAYNSIFIKDGKGFSDVFGAFEWIRDVATLLAYETATICGYNTIPIFNDDQVFSKFLKHGGYLIRPNDIKCEKPMLEVTHSFYELIEDATCWEQISESRKDIESLRRIRKINNLLKQDSNTADIEKIKDDIDNDIYEFERTIKTLGLQFRKTKQHLIIDIGSAASLGVFTVISALYGMPSPLTFSAISGTILTTSKAYISFKETKSITNPCENQIIKYIKANKEKIDQKFQKPSA